MWQTAIFMIAFTITFMISFRDTFIIGQDKDNPDSPLTFSMTLCRGIGFLIIGNFYDNVVFPKRLTFILLIILGILNALVRIYSLIFLIVRWNSY